MPNFTGRKNESLTAPFPEAHGFMPSGSKVSRPPLNSAAPARSVWSVLPDIESRPEGAYAGSNPKNDGAHIGIRIIEDARVEASIILRDACAQAAELLARAASDAQVTRSGAEAEGYAAGFLQARSQVEQELSNQFNRRVAQLRAEVDDTVRSIVDAREAMWVEVEGEIKSLALDIARKVIKTEVAQNAEVVGAVVKDALRRVADRSSVRIIVHPNLLDQVRENRADLLLALDNVQNLAIDADQRVSPGGCLIDTNAGCIDAKLETQLEQVEQALRG